MPNILKNIARSILNIMIALGIFLFILWWAVTQPIWVTNAKTWQAQADPEILKQHVIQLSEKLPERSHDVDFLNESAAYIHQHLSLYSNQVSYQNFDVMGIDYRNVIAKFGKARSHKQPIYVIGAHYDAMDGLPGADDNASGVAGILELARLFAKQPPPAPVQLVAYALEEPPYFGSEDMGSFRHAQMLHEQGTNVALMLSLEMIGYFTDKANSQDYPIDILHYVYPQQGNYIAVIGKLSDFGLAWELKKHMRQTSPLPVYSINAPAIIPGIDFSDHRNFWAFDYPAFMISDTAFFRNHHYHEATDTWQRLDYQAMAMVVDGVFQALMEISR